MDFSEALHHLKIGQRITRTGWNGHGMWIALSPGFTLPADRVYSQAVRDQIGDGVGIFRPYLMMFTADGQYVPWVASQTDLLADDWDLSGVAAPAGFTSITIERGLRYAAGGWIGTTGTPAVIWPGEQVHAGRRDDEPPSGAPVPRDPTPGPLSPGDVHRIARELMALAQRNLARHGTTGLA